MPIKGSGKTLMARLIILCNAEQTIIYKLDGAKSAQGNRLGEFDPSYITIWTITCANFCIDRKDAILY